MVQKGESKHLNKSLHKVSVSSFLFMQLLELIMTRVVKHQLP